MGDAVDAFDVARRDPWFWYCVQEALDTRELVDNWHCLYGYPMARSPIELMVDKATGAMEGRAKEFVRFVFDCIYTRIPRPQ